MRLRAGISGFCTARGHYGRTLTELKCFKAALDEQGVTHTAVAEGMEVTVQAVGYWFSGTRGIEPENHERLRRHHPEIVNVARNPSQHERDLRGYVAAVARSRPWLLDIVAKVPRERLTQELTKMAANAPTEELAEVDFWMLWFLHRHASWWEAARSKGPGLWEKARGYVFESLQRHYRAEQREDDAHPEIPNRTVAQLGQLMQTWSLPYVLAIPLLDAVCWTPPVYATRSH